jgi:hypothetical protein
MTDTAALTGPGRSEAIVLLAAFLIVVYRLAFWLTLRRTGTA